MTPCSEIKDEVVAHSEFIHSKFQKLHDALTLRETKLIQQLNAIANDKKSGLQTINETVTQQISESQQVMLYFPFLCSSNPLILMNSLKSYVFSLCFSYIIETRFLPKENH